MTTMTDHVLTLAEDWCLAAVRSDPDRFGYLADGRMARRPLPGDPHLACVHCGSVTTARVFSGPDVVCADASACRPTPLPPAPVAEAAEDEPEGDIADSTASGGEPAAPAVAEDAPDPILESAEGRS